MPIKQSASRRVYAFGGVGALGTPVAGNRALKFKTLKGFRGSFRFDAYEVPLKVTVRVSPDDSTYTNSAATPNLTAIVAADIPAHAHKTFEFLARGGPAGDVYIDVLATGNGKGELTFDPDIENNIEELQF